MIFLIFIFLMMDNTLLYIQELLQDISAKNTIQAVGELAGNPSDPRRTRSQFESALCMKDPLFVDK